VPACSGKCFEKLGDVGDVGDVDAVAADVVSATFHSISICGGKDV
jgi:hypothetical protein